MDLADMLIKKGVLKNPRLIEAFQAVDRKYFVPKELKSHAYIDEPLSIGEGQTISQPWTVAFMLELLDPIPGDNIMEIGYGSGWQTALLAATGANVYAIERVPKLCEFGKRNFEEFFKRGRGFYFSARFFCQDGTLGLPEIAKKIGGFDKIIVAAAGEKLPEAWKNQLKIGGKIVAPIAHSIFEFIKNPDGSFNEREHRGFAFVPLVPDKK
ncbi:protein-L-isoaspartate O-methyltransferase [Candidatus Giovannonibacteria bacterium RIFCSPLOWO2_12_FULL_44_25]|uniref:Protein-L-isoaspartate O-methyltransferase n=3 Tax=Parcubacteria group TaxID=1794811 RepID=A0A1F5WBM8_9BACT|nr:MAG: protein-L-isoaspartate O-methyltransferase [Candidatus Giovannonibacteria bacterium GWA2_45_15]OGF60121.1 MAG: protein-L-isoaspartate O-methyltransferase [Candidatus Giovannonibacteria bacterium RIFCSPHIGHO2_01_45_12]OGF60848.1 MAG: protein-L-isoaspartate O-methyltransferase [Candidatus Giovannonibacteria bacterium RIFCSPHIGHO2_01_FULL_44_100]OGF73043.1 MAG: protein-L-isoaspartate O-methyltransferase [Candidatus Giovannonibacteria bacterium RIFCSPHIGHO2_02_FULL_45_40]OGF84943.1 MAG: pro